MLNSANKLPTIVVLGTGGTIASSGTVATQLSDYTVGKGVDALIAAVPALSEVAQCQYEQISNIPSFLIGDEVLLKLAGRVNHLLAQSDVAGIVITHGTDTLEETAYFLNLVVHSYKPVVLVGAMRPATAISADGPLNLFHAAVVASSAQSAGRGVMVVMNDRILAARYVTKAHTTGVDTFAATEQGVLGVVSDRDVQYFNQTTRLHTTQSGLHIAADLKALPAVDIVYDHQGAGLHMYEAAIQAGVQGIVLAGTGNGSLSGVASRGASLAKTMGVAFVRSSHVGQGSVRPSVKDIEFNTIAAQSLNPQKARILLRLALLKTQDRETLQQLFNTY